MLLTSPVLRAAARTAPPRSPRAHSPGTQAPRTLTACSRPGGWPPDAEAPAGSLPWTICMPTCLRHGGCWPPLPLQSPFAPRLSQPTGPEIAGKPHVFAIGSLTKRLAVGRLNRGQEGVARLQMDLKARSSQLCFEMKMMVRRWKRHLEDWHGADDETSAVGFRLSTVGVSKVHAGSRAEVWHTTPDLPAVQRVGPLPATKATSARCLPSQSQQSPRGI
mmetsp:Transcript_25154/g.45817  ORF Transcript_25154/g.45817 Transcript_25154/m.45817 type:complete len:219 (-) Transcript_25154:661-1317(-)